MKEFLEHNVGMKKQTVSKQAAVRGMGKTKRLYTRGAPLGAKRHLISLYTFQVGTR